MPGDAVTEILHLLGLAEPTDPKPRVQPSNGQELASKDLLEFGIRAPVEGGLLRRSGQAELGSASSGKENARRVAVQGDYELWIVGQDGARWCELRGEWPDPLRFAPQKAFLLVGALPEVRDFVAGRLVFEPKPHAKFERRKIGGVEYLEIIRHGWRPIRVSKAQGRGLLDLENGLREIAKSIASGNVISDRAPAPHRGDGADSTLRESERPELEREDLTCIVRQLFADGVARPRGDAISALAKQLGYQRVGSRIHEHLDNAIRTAVRRGVLENRGADLVLLTPHIKDYERAFLKEQFTASLQGRAWVDRDDAIRYFARWLGFRRVGETIQKVADSMVLSLTREDRLETDGARIRRQS